MNYFTLQNIENSDEISFWRSNKKNPLDIHFVFIYIIVTLLTICKTLSVTWMGNGGYNINNM